MASDEGSASGGCIGLNMLYEVAVAALHNPAARHPSSMEISSSNENGKVAVRKSDKGTQTEMCFAPVHQSFLPMARPGSAFGPKQPFAHQPPGSLMFYNDIHHIDGVARISAVPTSVPTIAAPLYSSLPPWMSGFPPAFHQDSTHHVYDVQPQHMPLPSACLHHGMMPGMQYTSSLAGYGLTHTPGSAPMVDSPADNSNSCQTGLTAATSAMCFAPGMMDNLQSYGPCLADTTAYQSLIPRQRRPLAQRLNHRHQSKAPGGQPVTDLVSTTAFRSLTSTPSMTAAPVCAVPGNTGQLQEPRRVVLQAAMSGLPSAERSSLPDVANNKGSPRLPCASKPGKLASNTVAAAMRAVTSSAPQASHGSGGQLLHTLADRLSKPDTAMPCQDTVEAQPTAAGTQQHAHKAPAAAARQDNTKVTCSDSTSQSSSELDSQPDGADQVCSATQRGRTSPTNTPSNGQSARRPRAPNNMCERLTLSQLASVFHLPAEQAAIQLGVGQTLLKRVCRASGITRWPYRKVNSLKSLIQPLLAQEDAGNAADKQGDQRSRLVTHLAQLKARRAARVKSLGPFQMNLEQLLAHSAQHTAQPVREEAQAAMEVDQGNR